MSISFPMHVSFTVVGVTVSEYSNMDEGNLCSGQDFTLALRADDRTKIRLSSGELLKDVDVKLKLSSKWKTPEEVDRELQPQDIGFLHNSCETDSPSVHGAAIWPSGLLPSALLQGSVKGLVSLTLSSVPTVLDREDPFIWSCGRPHFIRISDISVSAIRDAPHDEP